MKNEMRKPRKNRSEYSQLLIPIIALALIVIFNLIRDPSFFLGRINKK